MRTTAAPDLAVTLLYVPADRPDRVAKALGLGADAVIVDLEDAVAPGAKDRARSVVPEAIDGRPDVRVQVRVNPAGTPWCVADLEMAAALPADVGVRLPKVNRPADVDDAVAVLGPDRPVHCLVESALGVENAFDIARHDAVASVGLGESDLRSELGVNDDRGLDWARGRIVVAAGAAGLPPPSQSVFAHVADTEGLAESTRAGRARGFVGRQAIHPAQLPVIRAAYRPEPAEVRGATELLDAYASAAAADNGAFVLPDGRFVDAAMLSGARRVLELDVLTRA